MASDLDEYTKYWDYLRFGELGMLDFEHYEKDVNGLIILHDGEAFCRWPSCPDYKTKYAFDELKEHIVTHFALPMEDHTTEEAIFANTREMRTGTMYDLADLHGVFPDNPNNDSQPRTNWSEWYKALADNASAKLSEKPKVPLTKNGLISKAKVRRIVERTNANISIPCLSCEKAYNNGRCCEDFEHCDWLKVFDITESLEWQYKTATLAAKATSGSYSLGL
ncbi:hypothetical protein N7454_005476 [Penicillium verhagenii]|nr:hypothetical protein N7454_005476 [Penicillium verhagenii]